jgi:hypothetical protein
MHSDPHLGISLAAMVHLAAATPNLGYACDTHFPWRHEDVLKGRPLAFRGGAIRVPDGPGLGVELDRDVLAALHEQYLRCGIRSRDDTGYMRRVDPGYRFERPRWLPARFARLRCRCGLTEGAEVPLVGMGPFYAAWRSELTARIGDEFEDRRHGDASLDLALTAEINGNVATAWRDA